MGNIYIINNNIFKMSKILTLSRKAIYDLIIAQEVSSKELYKSYPIWPQLGSGITIGIGYDIGKQSTVQVQKDWGGILHPELIMRLQKYCGKTGSVCKSYLPELKNVNVSWFLYKLIATL
jgi:hypothetical protein